MPAVKDKKRGTWYANFYYKDWTGGSIHKCKRGFKRKKDAEQWEKDFIEQNSKSSNMLYKNYIEIYIADKEARLGRRTMKTKRQNINTHILPYFGNLPLSEIDTVTVTKWQNTLLKTKKKDGKPYSPTYLRTLNNQLSASLNYAVKHYGLKSNPCTIVGTMGKKNADEKPFWTPSQYDTFIKTVKKSGSRAAFDTLYYSGIRTCELLGLTPRDVLSTKELDINKNFECVDGLAQFTDPKTPRSKRRISIPDFLYDEIQNYINSLYKLRPDERIFDFGEHYLQVEMQNLIPLTDLESISPHCLRHSHVALLIELDFDIMEISRRLGHDSVKVTLDTYGHMFQNKDAKIAKKLDEVKRDPSIVDDSYFPAKDEELTS